MTDTATVDHPDAKLLGWEAEIYALEETMVGMDDDEIRRFDREIVTLEWNIARAHAKGLVGLGVKVRRLRMDMDDCNGAWARENVCAVVDDLARLYLDEITHPAHDPNVAKIDGAA